MCSKHMRIFCTVSFKLYVIKDAEEHGNTVAGRHFGPTWTKNVWVGADESFAWPISQCQDGINILIGKRGLFMCRIASLFLLQRLEGNMSSDACDFTNIEMWPFFQQGKAPKDIHAILTETLGEHAPSYVTIKNWVAQYKLGDFSTCDAPHPGRPKTITTLEIIDQIHELILEDHQPDFG
jgi:hypothetical protein